MSNCSGIVEFPDDSEDRNEKAASCHVIAAWGLLF
jgi:hypothetical protein